METGRWCRWWRGFAWKCSATPEHCPSMAWRIPWMTCLSICTMGISANTALRSLPFGIAFSEEQEIMQEVKQTASTIEAINQFSDAFNQHDVQAGMALITQDCVFENTYPPPDGERFEGQEAVRHFSEEFFLSSPDPLFHSAQMI